MAPGLSLRMQEVDRTWKTRLEPTIARLLDSKEPPQPELPRQYLGEADAFVSSISEMVSALEQDAAARIQRLYWVQIGFLTLSILIVSGAMLLLHQQIRVPLGRLAQLVNRLLVGHEGAAASADGRRNELTTFTQTLEGLVERFLHDRDEIQALHATGQEIASLGALTLEEILTRIVNRAADLVSADRAALFLQHPFMECWIVEAASGKAFDGIRKQIMLFE